MDTPARFLDAFWKKLPPKFFSGQINSAQMFCSARLAPAPQHFPSSIHLTPLPPSSRMPTHRGPQSMWRRGGGDIKSKLECSPALLEFSVILRLGLCCLKKYSPGETPSQDLTHVALLSALLSFFA
jgi:hypothetical protein